ncbi:TRI39 ligase, partial [Polypterus senegalus]
MIEEHIREKGLDFMCLTETGHQSEGYSALNEACPPGYSFLEVARSTGCGGGLAIIHLQDLGLSHILIPATSSCECLAIKCDDDGFVYPPAIVKYLNRTPNVTSYVHDHKVVSMELPFLSPHTKLKRQIHFRNLNNINVDALALDLKLLSSDPTSSLSVADLVDFYNQSLSSLLDFHAPLTSSFIVVGPSKPVVTYVGEDVVLPASLSPALNAEAFEVRWFTTDFRSPELLYTNYNIGRQSDTRRTLSRDNLKNGNVSLIIRNVRVSDEHLYKCLVYSGQREEETQVSLTVEADVTFDPETANQWLIVSEDGKEVRDTDTWQRVTDNPKRFDRYPIVLAREGFTSGRHYWEVEVGGKTNWDLGVARESVNRKGEITVSPDNGYWTVCLRNENEYKAFDYSSVILPLRVKPQTVGVFLDYDEGQVSFYNAQSRSHLYTFTDSFTEPLYPYFNPEFNDGGKNAAPLVICPLRTH